VKPTAAAGTAHRGERVRVAEPGLQRGRRTLCAPMNESIEDRAVRTERVRLRVERIELRGRHGIHPGERTRGNSFRVDLEIDGDVGRAVATDRLEETIDYARMVQLVRQVNRRQSFCLIESLAGAIAEELLARFPAAERVAVRVAKLTPPGLGRVACTSAEVVKSRT